MKQSNEELEREFLESFKTSYGKIRLNKRMNRQIFALGIMMVGTSLVGIIKETSPLCDYILGLGMTTGLFVSLSELRNGFPLEKDEKKSTI